MDLIVGLTACSAELSNNGTFKPIDYEILPLDERRVMTVADLKALFLNCSLKPSPRVSNTQALIDKTAALFPALGVEAESIRVLDYKVAFGVGDGRGRRRRVARDPRQDPGVPTSWSSPRRSGSASGRRSPRWSPSGSTRPPTRSTLGSSTRCTARSAGRSSRASPTAARACIKSILYDMSIAGFTIPPNADCYWVGEAGLGGPYLEFEGRHLASSSTSGSAGWPTT